MRTDRPPASPTLRHHWTVRIAAVGLGLGLAAGLLTVAELGLRASAHWPDPPTAVVLSGWSQGARRVQSQDQPDLESTEVGGQPGWQTSRDLVRRRFMQDVAWTAQPQPGQLRVFAFGGSTTYGVPVEATPQRTFPGRMSIWLAALARPAEVINLGGASFGSDQVLRLAKATAAQQPDVMVVYTGNNEFFQYDLALSQRNQRYPLARRSAQRLHLFRALDAVLGPDPVVLSVDQAVNRQRQVVARIVATSLADPDQLPTVDQDGRWHRRDAHHDAVVGRFQTNLGELAQVTHDAHSRLLIVNVPPHLQQAPWLSLHDPDCSALTRRRIEHQLAASAQALRQAAAADAVDLAQRAVDLDPIFAASWHALGLALLAQDDQKGASLALHNALELDMDPGRPVAGLSDAVISLSTTQGGNSGVELVQLTELLDDPTAGAFGEVLFHDSCHLTAAAYDALGHLLARKIRDQAGSP